MATVNERRTATVQVHTYYVSRDNPRPAEVILDIRYQKGNLVEYDRGYNLCEFGQLKCH